MGLALRRWTAHECMRRFEELAHSIFQRRTSGSMLFNRVQEFIMSYVADCKYDTTTIEDAFRKAFGDRTKLLGAAGGRVKVAVTGTTVRESQACLFTSYNGPVGMPNRTLVRSARPGGDVTLAEA